MPNEDRIKYRKPGRDILSKKRFVPSQTAFSSESEAFYELGLWQQDAYPVRNRCPRLGQRRITCDMAIYQQ